VPTSRTISAGTTTELAKKEGELGWLIELAFESFTGRYCSFDDKTWNSNLFTRASFKVQSLDTAASAAKIDFFDDAAAIRTLCLTGAGVRNRSIKIWKAYFAALGSTDPIFMFKGVGGQVDIAGGRVAIIARRMGQDLQFAPRKRLGPSTGCTFLAAPGTMVPWGQRVIRLEPSRG
jgi:hypothetical protein